MSPVRIGLVLSGGGLRGAAHLGVLQRLVAHDIPLDVIVGASAGAVVAAYYAAVGLTLDELIADARTFRGRHLIAHSMNVRLHLRLDRMLGRRSGLIPTRLAQLERATFERLYHDVRGIGVVCHDLTTGAPCYFSTGCHRGARLSEVVRASASIPFLLPSVPVKCGDESFLLTDGGISDCLPVAFAQRPPLSATHLIVSDCRWLPRLRLAEEAGASAAQAGRSLWNGWNGEHCVHIKPRLSTTGTLWAPSSTLLAAVQQGAAAVTDEVLERIRTWKTTTSAPVSFESA